MAISLWGSPVARAREQALEDAARRLEQMGGNELYKRAYRKAARVIRSMRDFNAVPDILNDTQEQISSTSTRPV